MSFAALAASAAEKTSEIPKLEGLFLILVIFCGALLALPIVLFIVLPIIRKCKASSKKKQEKLFLLRQYGAQISDKFTLLSGLPLSSGTVCTVMIAPNGYIFLYDNKTYQLAFDKIHDVILHENYKEFLQPYGLDSSLRIQSQRVSSTSYTLNFLYKDGDFINEIIFSCPSKARGEPFANVFTRRSRPQESVIL